LMLLSNISILWVTGHLLVISFISSAIQLSEHNRCLRMDGSSLLATSIVICSPDFPHMMMQQWDTLYKHAIQQRLFIIKISNYLQENEYKTGISYM
jgi:hypothetical protein